MTRIFIGSLHFLYLSINSQPCLSLPFPSIPHSPPPHSHTHTHPHSPPPLHTLPSLLNPPHTLPSLSHSHRYAAVRLLELIVSIDYASLQLLVLDLGADFSFVSREQQLSVKAPQLWAEEFCLTSLSPEKRLQVRGILFCFV